MLVAAVLASGCGLVLSPAAPAPGSVDAGRVDAEAADAEPPDVMTPDAAPHDANDGRIDARDGASRSDADAAFYADGSDDADAATSTEWMRIYGGIGDDVGNGIAIDELGNVYVTGALGAPATFSMEDGDTTIGITAGSAFVLGIDESGRLRWARALEPLEGRRSVGRGIAYRRLDGEGTLRVVGEAGTGGFMAQVEPMAGLTAASGTLLSDIGPIADVDARSDGVFCGALDGPEGGAFTADEAIVCEAPGSFSMPYGINVYMIDEIISRGAFDSADRYWIAATLVGSVIGSQGALTAFTGPTPSGAPRALSAAHSTAVTPWGLVMGGQLGGLAAIAIFAEPDSEASVITVGDGMIDVTGLGVSGGNLYAAIDTASGAVIAKIDPDAGVVAPDHVLTAAERLHVTDMALDERSVYVTGWIFGASAETSRDVFVARIDL